jgi:hypothetical protein
MSNIYKNHIDNFLSNFQENINSIYGGITEHELYKRKDQHIKSKEPKNCNSEWIISDKAITTINITNKHSNEYYKKIVSDVEQYLIDELFNKYNDKCKNDINKDGTPAKRGGNGINIILGDSIKFYIFYKLA